MFLFRCFINLHNGEAVLNIIAHASGFTKFIFRHPMSSLIPEHKTSRFRDKFLIIEAILNVIVQTTAYASPFFFYKRAISYFGMEFSSLYCIYRDADKAY